MAVTIEELLINLGVDVSGLKTNLSAAERSLDGVAAAGDRVKSSFTGIEDVTGNVVTALRPITTTAGAAAASVIGIGEASKKISFGELGVASALVATNLRDIGTASKVASVEMAGSSGAAASLGKNLALMALQGEVSAARLLNVVASLKALRDAQAGVAAAQAAGAAASATSVGASAAGALANAAAARAAAGAAASASATSAAASAGAVAAVGAALVAFAPVAIPAAAAALLVRSVFKTWGDQAAADGAKIKAGVTDTSTAIAKFTADVADINFESSISNLDALEKAVARNNRAIDKAAADAKGKGEIFAQGLSDSLKADFLSAKLKTAWDNAKAESQAGGAAVTAEFKKTSDDSLAALASLEKSLQFKPSEETLAGLRALGASLDFKGPLGELTQLQAALDANAIKVRELAEQAGLGEDFIRDEIAKTNALIKGRFKDDVKLKATFDGAQAEAEAQKTLDKLNALPPAQTTLKFSEGTLQRLLLERSTILSRIADAPTAVIKLQAQAELNQVDADIAAERAKQEADPITLTAKVDKGQAEKDIEELRRLAARPIGVGGGDVPLFKETGGPAASGQEIVGMVAQFKTELASALSSGNAETVRSLKEGAAGFLANFGGGIRKLASISIGGQNAQAASAVNQLQDIVRGLGFTVGAAPATDLNSAFRDFQQKQQEQINLQRSNVAASNQTVDAINTLGRNVVAAGRNSANDTARASGAA